MRTPNWKAVGSAAVTIILMWAALANIAPKIFSLPTGPEEAATKLSAWLWNPALIWIALPLGVAWFAFLLYKLDARIGLVERHTEVVARSIAERVKKLEGHTGIANQSQNRQAIEALLVDLDAFIRQGETLLDTVSAHPTAGGNLGADLHMITAWEGAVEEWLRKYRPPYEVDFMAGWGASITIPWPLLISRLDHRIERLRSLRMIMHLGR